MNEWYESESARGARGAWLALCGARGRPSRALGESKPGRPATRGAVRKPSHWICPDHMTGEDRYTTILHIAKIVLPLKNILNLMVHVMD